MRCQLVATFMALRRTVLDPRATRAYPACGTVLKLTRDSFRLGSCPPAAPEHWCAASHRECSKLITSHIHLVRIHLITCECHPGILFARLNSETECRPSNSLRTAGTTLCSDRENIRSRLWGPAEIGKERGGWKPGVNRDDGSGMDYPELCRGRVGWGTEDMEQRTADDGAPLNNGRLG